MPAASVKRPLERLADAVAAFVRDKAHRLLCVEVDLALREGALGIAMAAEYLADNRSPLLAIDLDGRDREPCWEVATDALRRSHEHARADGGPLAPLAERPLRASGAASFAAQLLQAIGTVRAPAQGVLYLLAVAPHDEVDATWLARVGEILLDARLVGAKTVVVLRRAPSVAPWIATLDPALVAHHVAVIDEALAIRELEAEIEAEETLGPGRNGAWPTTPPFPRRRGGAAASRGGPAAQIALEPTTADVDFRLRLLVKRAALAHRRGDGPEAVARQAEARDLCADSGRIGDAVRMELLLGAYLVQLEQFALAVDAFERAAFRAEGGEHWELAMQGWWAQAATHDGRGELVEALGAYRRALAAAQEHGAAEPVLRTYWEASRVALRLDLEADARSLLADAFAEQQTRDRSELSGTMAPEINAELVRLLARCRRFAEAREVERSLERPRSA